MYDNLTNLKVSKYLKLCQILEVLRFLGFNVDNINDIEKNMPEYIYMLKEKFMILSDNIKILEQQYKDIKNINNNIDKL